MENGKELSPVTKEIEKLDKSASIIEASISALIIKLEPILTPPGPEAERSEKEKVPVAISPLANTLESTNCLLESSIDRLSRAVKRIEV